MSLAAITVVSAAANPTATMPTLLAIPRHPLRLKWNLGVGILNADRNPIRGICGHNIRVNLISRLRTTSALYRHNSVDTPTLIPAPAVAIISMETHTDTSSGDPVEFVIHAARLRIN